MEKKIINVMGMPLERWTNEGCVADFGVGEGWATLYHIETEPSQRNKGYATALLVEAKKIYESQGKLFGGSVALSPAMKHIYEKQQSCKRKKGKERRVLYSVQRYSKRNCSVFGI
jgi:GNAT superfamily N-acetyltransferase